MKKIWNILLSVAAIAALALSMVACAPSQEKIDAAVKDATADLNASVDELNSRLAALQGELATLETALSNAEAERDILKDQQKTKADELKEAEAALETLLEEKETLVAQISDLKQDLACLNGDHISAPEKEVIYQWHDVFGSCTAHIPCGNCVGYLEESMSVTQDGTGAMIATFPTAPEARVMPPTVTSLSFDTTSPAYDSEKNLFVVSEEHPLVITVTGENLDILANMDDSPLILCVSAATNFQELITVDIIRNEYVTIVSPTTILVTIPHDFVYDCKRNGWTMDQFMFYDRVRKEYSDAVELNMSTAEYETGVTLYAGTAEELTAALEVFGASIKLTADIESDRGFNVWGDKVSLDLCGFDVTVNNKQNPSFWTYYDFTLTDSVGGGVINEQITNNGGYVTIIGDVLFSVEDTFMVGTGVIDLSQYTGVEFKLYVSATGYDIILPEGYVLRHTSGTISTTVEEAIAVGLYQTLIPQ